jgi:protein Mpv17
MFTSFHWTRRNTLVSGAIRQLLPSRNKCIVATTTTTSGYASEQHSTTSMAATVAAIGVLLASYATTSTSSSRAKVTHQMVTQHFRVNPIMTLLRQRQEQRLPIHQNAHNIAAATLTASTSHPVLSTTMTILFNHNNTGIRRVYNQTTATISRGYCHHRARMPLVSSSVYQPSMHHITRHHQPMKLASMRPSYRCMATTSSSSSSSTTTTTASASAAATQPHKSTNASLMEWYEGHLRDHPILTKMITGSLLWGIGDGVAQIIPQLQSQSTSATEDNNNNSHTFTAFHYDYIRTGRAAFFGLAIHAPLSHMHYNFLEYMTVQMKFTGYSIPIFKAFMEQFVYWSWISNSIYFAAMGAMQGMDLSQIYQRIYDVLWETQVAQWAFWIPIQLINFQYTPVRHQLNVVLLTSVVWTALLSMWYPPIQSSTTKQDEPEK